MKTTKDWLEEVTNNSDKFNRWLERQYVGEMLAADRIRSLAEMESPFKYTLKVVADQELVHAKWIRGLLIKRKIALPEVTLDGTRYWEPILGELINLDELCAAGHHAEAMRLVRIRAIADCNEMPDDVRKIFKRIESDEAFHAEVFGLMSTEAAKTKTFDLHLKGLEMLGLTL